MRKYLFIAVVVLAAVGVLSARSGGQPPPAEEAEKKLIDLKSDLMGPIAPGDSVLFLVGNFAAQHNGAVITCDSAVRYSPMKIEFFGNVLINKNTTYIYGDRAIYDGEINQAEVFSDLVKVVDGDATLYTYKFLFNTKDNIGEFSDGAVMINRENELESVRGFYYADTKELIAVDEVEMRNDEYELKGDSVVYNMATDNAYFFERTNIWNTDGDYLYADRGSYQKRDTLYLVTRNGYVLTEKQEVWSDSIDYYRIQEHLILRRDIQMDDTEHKVLAFGDFGEYWKEPGNAFLTREPVVISYDAEQGDSLFARADSMFLYTINLNAEKRAAEAAKVAEAQLKADSVARAAGVAAGVAAGGLTPENLPAAMTDSLLTGVRPTEQPTPQSQAPGFPQSADSLRKGASLPDSLGRAMLPDSLQSALPDSLATQLADTVRLTPAEQKAKLQEAALKAKAEQKAAAAAAKKAKLEEVAAKRREKLKAQQERDEARAAAARLKAESKLRARIARAQRKGKKIEIDSTLLQRPDSLAALPDSLQQADSLGQDSLAMMSADSLDSLASLDSIPLADSIYRLIKGYRRVKMYRSDFQSVCDSMTVISTDSTIHLYIEPVLWNQSNQITSDVMDIFTENQKITRAEFVGTPMMVSQLDTLHYNQVAGKEMTAYFRNNAIYRDDVNGNAQTIYYMQDGEPPVVTDVGFIESGDCSFFIEDKQVITITYRKDPEWHIYSLNKIPADRDLFLKGFKWEGDRRPTQQEVFERRIRPSEREKRSKLPHPTFPIRARINDYRKQLIEQRRWFDRTEPVDEETVEWMRTLGYEVGKPREESKTK